MKIFTRAARTASIRRLAVFARLATLPGCDLFEPSCEDCGGFPIPATSPARFDLAPGDSTSVIATVTNTPGPTDGLPVRWRSANPAIVRVDSTGFTGRPTALRALAPGETWLTGEITRRGHALTVRVPVDVRARP